MASGMPWFRTDTDWEDHPKVRALCAELRQPLGAIYVSRFWSYTARYFPDGDLRVDEKTLEHALRWSGQRGALVAALFKVGLLDKTNSGLSPHDWWEHNGGVYRKWRADNGKRVPARPDPAGTQPPASPDRAASEPPASPQPAGSEGGQPRQGRQIERGPESRTSAENPLGTPSEPPRIPRARTYDTDVTYGTEGERAPPPPAPASHASPEEAEDLAVYEVFRATFPETEPSSLPSFQQRSAIRDRRKQGATVEQCTKAIRGAKLLWTEEPDKNFVKHLRTLPAILGDKHFGPCVARFNDGPKGAPKPAGPPQPRASVPLNESLHAPPPAETVIVSDPPPTSLEERRATLAAARRKANL